MDAPRLAAARDLVEDVRAALDAADLEQVMATLDGINVGSGVRHGIVVVSPPSFAFPTWAEPVVTWELHAIAGPATDYLAAWEKLDAILEALAAGHINIAKAEPGGFAQPNGPAIPSYTITLNPLD